MFTCSFIKINLLNKSQERVNEGIKTLTSTSSNIFAAKEISSFKVSAPGVGRAPIIPDATCNINFDCASVTFTLEAFLPEDIDDVVVELLSIS